MSAKTGCSAYALLEWVKRAEVDGGKQRRGSHRAGRQVKALERENRELRQVNEILRSAYFGQAELDRPFRR